MLKVDKTVEGSWLLILNQALEIGASLWDTKQMRKIHFYVCLS